MTRFEKIDVWFKWFGAFVAVVGIIFYFVDKKIDRDLSRETNSFSLIDAYYSDDVFKARRTLQSFWAENAEAVSVLKDEKLTKRAVAAILTRKINTHPNKSRLIEAISEHVGFFDRLSVCIDNDVCSDTSLEKNFCEIGSQVNSQYGAYIERGNRLAGSRLLGEGLAKFLGRCS